MKLFCVTLLLLCTGLIDPALGLSKRVHHHPHPGVPADQLLHHPITCLDKYCDDHRSTCRIHIDGDHIHGDCEEPEHCDHHPQCNPAHHHDHECCCKTTQCVTDFVAGANTPDTLNCLQVQCDARHQTCVIVNRHGPNTNINGRCEERHRCDDWYWFCVDDHGHVDHHHHECCCTDQQCVSAALGLTNTTTSATKAPATVPPKPNTATPAHTPVPTTASPVVQTNAPTTQPTTPIPLYCPVCADDFTADCQSNSMCKANEGCMLQVVAGKLKTGCAEINDCEFHERIGNSICCKDKNCTDVAFRDMHTMSYTCPTCQHSSDPRACMNTQGKCSYLSKGCMITHNSAGISSGCNTHAKACQNAEASNSVLCNVLPIPFAFQPGLQCSFCCHRNESTCIMDALGIHDVSTTQPPTVAHTAGTTASTCFDIEDSTFNCKSFDSTYQLCSHTSGLMAHLAVTKCRKTCGICGGSGGVGATVPVTLATTTKAATSQTTTTPKLHCIDHDINNNCVLMSSVLCATQNTHGRNYAIANCAKTCNLCKEYFQHLSGLTIPSGR
ncbi:uncharacterized protein LOC117315159 [Pecten maximus]|uniref:uncharacterized protein LOC117315159 n=1 Tax=Pecten maximus TaxID=6579 RepID=UPI0014582C78|nr:uncharacterized protein LOC117315159 [Pecten maximus]